MEAVNSMNTAYGTLHYGGPVTTMSSGWSQGSYSGPPLSAVCISLLLMELQHAVVDENSKVVQQQKIAKGGQAKGCSVELFTAPSTGSALLASTL